MRDFPLKDLFDGVCLPQPLITPTSKPSPPQRRRVTPFPSPIPQHISSTRFFRQILLPPLPPSNNLPNLIAPSCICLLPSNVGNPIFLNPFSDEDEEEEEEERARNGLEVVVMYNWWTALHI